jgi:hypothetical protein
MQTRKAQLNNFFFLLKIQVLTFSHEIHKTKNKKKNCRKENTFDGNENYYKLFQNVLKSTHNYHNSKQKYS